MGPYQGLLYSTNPEVGIQWYTSAYLHETDNNDLGAAASSLLTEYKKGVKSFPPLNGIERGVYKWEITCLSRLYSSKRVLSKYRDMPYEMFEIVDHFNDSRPVVEAAIMTILGVTGNRLSNIWLLYGHQIEVHPDGLSVTWYVRKVQTDVRYSMEVCYLFEWSNITMHEKVRRFFEDAAPDAPLFQKICDEARKLSTVVNGWVGSCKNKETGEQLFPGFSCRVARCQLATALYSLNVPAKMIVALMDHTKETAIAHYVNPKTLKREPPAKKAVSGSLWRKTVKVDEIPEEKAKTLPNLDALSSSEDEDDQWDVLEQDDRPTNPRVEEEGEKDA